MHVTANDIGVLISLRLLTRPSTAFPGARKKRKESAVAVFGWRSADKAPNMPAMLDIVQNPTLPCADYAVVRREKMAIFTKLIACGRMVLWYEFHV